MFTPHASFLSVVNSILFPNTRLSRSLLLRYGRIDLRATQLCFHSILVSVLSLNKNPRMVLEPPNSQFSNLTPIKLQKSHSESDLFAGASEGKAQIKRFKLFMSCHSEETEETSTADNRAEAPAGLRTLAS